MRRLCLCVEKIAGGKKLKLLSLKLKILLP